MEISLQDKGSILRRVRAISVPRTISMPVYTLVIKWIQNSGVEWTTDRLKQVKVDFLRKKGGLLPVSQWIGKGKGSRWFKGPIGSLETWAFEDTSHFEKALSLLNLYTFFFSAKVTPKQAKKFIDGVAAQATPLPPDLAKAVKLGFQLSGLRSRRKPLPLPAPLLAYNPSPTKRAPVPRGTVPEVEGVVDSLRFLSLEGGLRHLHKFQDIYAPVLSGLEPEMDVVQLAYSGAGIRSMNEPLEQALLVGQIGLIQEAGLKLRAVANPGRVFQQVLEPLGKVLYGTLRSLPWDCTFKQDKADHAVLAHLNSHKRVFSVDLSGATDYFPLDLQELALREFLPSCHYVDLFLEVSRGWWRVPKNFPEEVLHTHGFNERRIQWSKGQPLGLYPSFASFAFTHGLLLLGLLGRLWNDDFFVLGDDVVILNEELYDLYRKALYILGCPVSEPKTLESDKVAEFRSVIFTDGRVIPQFKWREVSDDSFLDILRNNPHLVPLLRKRQRTVVELIKELPEFLGGLGWNSMGKTIDERLEPFMDYLLRMYGPLDRLMGYTSQVRQLLYGSSLSLSAGASDTDRNVDITSALDQRARDLVKEYIGDSFEPLYEILGRNLDLVLCGNTDLPILGKRSLSRITTLQQWESILDKLDLLPPEV